MNDKAMTVAVNAVAPAIQAWEMRRQQQIGNGRKLLDALAHREPLILPLSLRDGIAQAIVQSLAEAGLLKETT